MAKGHLGSFIGAVTPDVNMIDLFKAQEEEKHVLASRKWPASIPFSIQQLSISADPGTTFTLNTAQIVIPSTGIFELSYGLIEIESLVFHAQVNVNIVYLF